MTLGSVVVFGATSGPGTELCRLLSADGRHVVAISAGEGDISGLAPLDVEIRTMHASNKSAVKTVTADLPAAQTVVSLVSESGAINVIDAAIASGARRFVLVTSIGGGESRKALSFLKRISQRKKLKQMTLAEERLRGAKLSWTLLRPGPYAGRKPTGHGILVENPLAYGTINAKDLARALYDVLDNTKTAGKVYSVMDMKRAKVKDGTPIVAAEI